MNEGRTTISVIPTRPVDARVGSTLPVWARVTRLADVDDGSTRVTRHAGTEAALHDGLEEWLHVVGGAPRGLTERNLAVAGDPP